jgi:hypothetical protein
MKNVKIILALELSTRVRVVSGTRQTCQLRTLLLMEILEK